MKRKYPLLLGILAIWLVVPASWAYDAQMAGRFAQLFEPVQGARAGKALHLIAPEELVRLVKQGERVVALDVRTPAELGICGMTTPDALSIPINVLFKPENLDRVPTDRKVVVVCGSGTRATAAGIALRQVGFENVYVLKGGLNALAGYLNPKTANMPLASAN